jgi:serine/threonine protein kinase
LVETMKLINGQYQIERILTETENSILYKCWDRLRYCYVIAKVAKTEEGENQLSNEIAILKLFKQQPKCPGLPWLICEVKEGGTRYCVMEYINGYNLAEELRREVYSPGEIAEWMTEVIDIMIRLHTMKPAIIYRDLKPENIIRNFEGQITLIDYGIAKVKKDVAMRDAIATGTKEYAAPEQWGDHQGNGKYCTDERSDIYSFGKTVQAVFHMAGKKMTQNMECIILKCTGKLPMNRYNSFQELQKDWNEMMDWDFC